VIDTEMEFEQIANNEVNVDFCPAIGKIPKKMTIMKHAKSDRTSELQKQNRFENSDYESESGGSGSLI